MFSNVQCKAQFNMLRKVEASLRALNWKFDPLVHSTRGYRGNVDRQIWFVPGTVKSGEDIYKVTSSLRNWYKQVTYDCVSTVEPATTLMRNLPDHIFAITSCDVYRNKSETFLAPVAPANHRRPMYDIYHFNDNPRFAKYNFSLLRVTCAWIRKIWLKISRSRVNLL